MVNKSTFNKPSKRIVVEVLSTPLKTKPSVLPNLLLSKDEPRKKLMPSRPNEFVSKPLPPRGKKPEWPGLPPSRRIGLLVKNAMHPSKANGFLLRLSAMSHPWESLVKHPLVPWS